MGIYGGSGMSSVGISGGFYPGGLTNGGVGGGAPTGKYNVLQNGVAANNQPGNAGALSTLITAVSGLAAATFYWPAGTYRIDGNVSMPANVTNEFAPGALLVVDAAATLSFAGPISAPPVHVFGGSGAVRFSGAPMAATFLEWFGSDNTGSADSTAALVAAIAAVSAVAGTACAPIILSPGAYKITQQVTVPPQVRIVGSGMRSTQINSSVADFLFVFGSTDGTLAYGCGIRDLSIICSNAAGGGVWHRGTAGFEIANVYFEGQPSTSTGTGLFLDGCQASNIFSVYKNVIVNHFKFGLRIGTTGTIFPTSLTALGLNVFGDVDAGGRGIQIDASCGDGHRFYGGNVERYETGLYIVGGGSCFNGVRFEANTTDVLFPTATSGPASQFLACVNLNTVTNAAGAGYNNHSFVGCTKSDQTPRGAALWGAHTFNAFAAGDVPVLVQGYPGQTAHLLSAQRSDSQELFGIDNSGFALLYGGVKVDGNQVVGARQAAIASPAGGTTVDTQARAAIDAIRAALQAHGLTA